jgi:hypothetical protein
MRTKSWTDWSPTREQGLVHNSLACASGSDPT